MTQFHLDQSNRFVITGYPEMRPFSSFLPGIAGLLGIPLWVFYVNRGQAITSFGVESKDSPIIEFQSANRAYQNTSLTGFRTFIKINRKDERVFYEPFSPWSGVQAEDDEMAIGLNALELKETNSSLGIDTRVRYFLLANEPFGGLVRLVTIQNTTKDGVSFELIDGTPNIIPYGVNNFLLKEMGRTVEAWMEVSNLEAGVPFYSLRASVVDRAEVETYRAGNFAMAFVEDGKPLPALVDPALVFGQDTTFYQPAGFFNQTLETLLMKQQITCGRTPCGFFAHRVELASGESLSLSAIYGHVGDLEVLTPIVSRVAHADYLEEKYREAVGLADQLTDVVATHTSSPFFDAYCRQNFLDNVLRGGWPVHLGGHIYPVYSRKHGDLERDYNAFFLSPEPYSQGEGSYRDVNQNRRDTVILNPEIGDFDIRTFLSLIQADGYNPRSIKGITFQLTSDQQNTVLAYTHQPQKLQASLKKPFTPGKLLRAIADNRIRLQMTQNEFINLVLKDANPLIEADFHEGYWIDHWEYNLDLIESYLMVFPDRKADLLLGTADMPFFDSPMVVQSRAKRYVLVNNLPRQLNSLLEDPEKVLIISNRTDQQHWVRAKDGRIYRVTLYAKLLLIALLKFVTLDPWGMGIEMEASRPGWDDALNGLPGLFGSGMAETYELLRWLNFLRDEIPANKYRGFQFPQEAADLLEYVLRELDIYNQSSLPNKLFTYWDSVASDREKYRQQIRSGFDGTEAFISFEDLMHALDVIREKVIEGIQRGVDLNQGLPPTYFMYKVEEYDVLEDSDPQGHPYIRPRRFTPIILPLFLEGSVRAFKTLNDQGEALRLYNRVKASPLFDPKLHMYKVNASLASQPHDIGRARAFPAGWLENESIWLHMEYKYLLETLKAGLYEQFYTDMKDMLVPFLDPNIYGRSVLENSSFLVSSAHPDESLHGAGFVARLSGSTAEFISIWNIMMAGKHPFIMKDGQLCLALRPSLPGWLFTESGEVSFYFLGHCMVTYHNPTRRNTHPINPQCIVFTTVEAGVVEVAGSILESPYSNWVREGKITKLDIWF